MAAIDVTQHFHVAIKVASGGTVTFAWVKSDERPGDWEYITAVHTSIPEVLLYIERVLKDLEGPGYERYGDKLGNVKLPETGI